MHLLLVKKPNFSANASFKSKKYVNKYRFIRNEMFIDVKLVSMKGHQSKDKKCDAAKLTLRAIISILTITYE